MGYVISRESGICKIVSAILALIVHTGLVLFLVLGVQWATDEMPARVPLSAELWSAAQWSEIAVPLAEPIKITSSVSVSEPSLSVETPLAPPIETAKLPEPEVTAEPVSQADIALKQSQPESEKKKKADELLTHEQVQRLTQEKQAQEKQQQKALAETQRLAQEKEAQHRQEKEKAEAVRKQERVRQEMNEQARREAMLKESLRRERAGLQSSSGQKTTVTGTTASSIGQGRVGGSLLMREQAAYVAKIRAIVTPNIRYDPVFAETVQGTPEAAFEVSLLLDGTIGRVVLKESSGNVDYNRIIKAAIDKTGRLPLPNRPEILPERRLILRFRYP